MFPAECLGEEFEGRGYTVTFLTDRRGGRFLRLFKDRASFIRCGTPSTRRPMAFVRAIFALGIGFIQCLIRFIWKRPVAVIGFGGYPSFPALAAAFLLRIPIYLQEQNTVLGRVNRLFMRMCRALFTATQQLPKNIPPQALPKIVATGVPIRSSFCRIFAPYEPSYPDAPFHLLIFGGSQGSRFLTTVVAKAMGLLPISLRKRLIVWQQCGVLDEKKLRQTYDAAHITYTLAPFFEDMAQAMTWAHLIIARSGAMTVQEICCVKRPTLFVPLGNALDQDQLENASQLVQKEQAFLCLEKDFSAMYLSQFLTHHMAAPEGLIKVVEAMQENPPPIPQNAAREIVEFIERQLK